MMAISVQCECGKQYRVKDELAGRRVKCKQCAGTFVAPVIAEVVQPEFQAEVVEAIPAANHDATTAHENVTEQRRLQSELAYAQQKSNSAASNPGMIRVSYLRWTKSFPKWVVIWHVLLVASLVLTILAHWTFGFLLLLFVFAVYIYWRQVKYQFIAGCVNPAQVVSLVESSDYKSDAKEGLALTNSIVLYKFSNSDAGSFQYDQLVGAFSFSKGLELAFKSGQRLLLPKSLFLSGTQIALERLFNAIVRVK
jgi:hypothetical protein